MNERFPGVPGGFARLLLLIMVTAMWGCGGPGRTIEAPAADPTVTAGAEAVWPAAASEQQELGAGMPEAMLREAGEWGLNLHSLLVIREGYLVFEWYAGGYGPDSKHELYSVTKSFIATLAGIAHDQGLIEGVEQPIADFLPVQDFPNPDRRKASLTFEDLLTMQAGLEWNEGMPAYQEMYRQPDWTAHILSKPMVEAPGTRFNYCSGCSHLISAALSQAVGGDLPGFAREYLFEPLGIEELSWETDPQGVPIGGWGLRLTSRDMARLGYLYLREGGWNGRQIVSPEWVAAATTAWVRQDETLGYGYQWWIYPELGGYAAQGLGGQTVLVLPEHELVVVTTAQDTDHGLLVPLIEKHIIGALER